MTFVIVGKVELPELFSEWMWSLLFSMETHIPSQYEKVQYQFDDIKNDVDDGMTIRICLEIRSPAFVFNES